MLFLPRGSGRLRAAITSAAGAGIRSLSGGAALEPFRATLAGLNGTVPVSAPIEGRSDCGSLRKGRR